MLNLFEFLLILLGSLQLIDNRLGIVLLLPFLNLLVKLVIEDIVRGQVNLGHAIGLIKRRHPRVLHGAVLGALLQVVAPLFRPRLETLRVRLLDVRSLRDHLSQVVAQLVAVFASLHRSLELSDLVFHSFKSYYYITSHLYDFFSNFLNSYLPKTITWWLDIIKFRHFLEIFN